MNKKIFTFILIVCTAFRFNSFTSSAHTTSQEGIIKKSYIQQYGGWYIGGEDIGWSIDESCHAGTATIAYRITTETGTTLPSGFAYQVSLGASRWGPTVNITTNTNNASVVGNIYICDIKDPNTVAQYVAYLSDSNGHLTAWDIQVNTLYIDEITPATIAHEFGHVIGLNDLYDDYNNNKIMYGYTSGITPGPVSADIYGAEVITGQHSTHTWTSDPYTVHTCTDCGGYGTHTPTAPYRSADGARHWARCSGCSNLVYENHSLDPLAGECSKCGYSGGVTIFSAK